MKTQPHPKTLNRKPTVQRPGLLSPEQTAAPIPPLHALILEKLGQVQHTESLRADAANRLSCAEVGVKVATAAKNDAMNAHTAVIGKFEVACRDLGEVLKGLPDQPVRFAGSLWIYTTGTGLRRYSDQPLTLGGQS